MGVIISEEKRVELRSPLSNPDVTPVAPSDLFDLTSVDPGLINRCVDSTNRALRAEVANRGRADTKTLYISEAYLGLTPTVRRAVAARFSAWEVSFRSVKGAPMAVFKPKGTFIQVAPGEIP